MLSRQELRQTIRAQRHTLSLAEQQSASQQLTQHLSQQTIFTTSQHIAAYIAHVGEIDPMPLLEAAWQQNKICYLPKLTEDNKLHFIAYFPGNNLTLNQYKIPEPEFSAEKIIAPTQLDLVLLPLVAFDKQGNRLGMGAGYYDRTFAFLQKKSRPARPFLLGLAYEFQQVDALQTESWDVRLDGVATEENFYLISG